VFCGSRVGDRKIENSFDAHLTPAQAGTRRHERAQAAPEPDSRAYAIGLAAGTQAFAEGIGGAVFGAGVVQGDLAKGAGWVINLAVVEWAIRHATTPALRSRAGWRHRYGRRAEPAGASL
jgi:hypothetical protein